MPRRGEEEEQGCEGGKGERAGSAERWQGGEGTERNRGEGRKSERTLTICWLAAKPEKKEKKL